jgi:hypothetical protein
MVLADSVEESREVSEKLKDKSIIAGVEDISSYLPSVAEQKERLHHIRDIKSALKRNRSNSLALRRATPPYPSKNNQV